MKKAKLQKEEIEGGFQEEKGFFLVCFLGIAVLVGFILESMVILIGSLSFGLISIGIYDFSRLFLCKTKVKAMYIGHKSIKSQGRVNISQDHPIFSFEYKGKNYKVIGGEGYLFRIDKHFSKGNQYEILIYDKNPKITLRKKSELVDGVFLILMGIFICIIAI